MVELRRTKRRVAKKGPGIVREPGEFKQSAESRVTKPALPKKKKKKTTSEEKAPAKTVYAQPDGLTGKALFDDLRKSYVGTAPLPPAPVLGARQKRWKHSGRKPITDPKDVPADWNSHEPDLDPKYISPSWKVPVYFSTLHFDLW
jgi:hypothetical protein